MKNVTIVILTLALSANAFAATQDDESIIQRRGEVTAIYSMQDVFKDGGERAVKASLNSCLKYHAETACKSDSVEPFVARIHYTLGIDNGSLLQPGSSLKIGNIVLTQDVIGGLSEVIKVIQEDEKSGLCKFKFALQLMGTQRIECPDDKQNGWEETRSILEFYPLKHAAAVQQ